MTSFKTNKGLLELLILSTLQRLLPDYILFISRLGLKFNHRSYCAYIHFIDRKRLWTKRIFFDNGLNLEIWLNLSSVVLRQDRNIVQCYQLLWYFLTEKETFYRSVMKQKWKKNKIPCDNIIGGTCFILIQCFIIFSWHRNHRLHKCKWWPSCLTYDRWNIGSWVQASTRTSELFLIDEGN